MLLRNGAVPQGASLNVIKEDGGVTTVPVAMPRPGEPLVLRLAPSPGSAIPDGAAVLGSAVPHDAVSRDAVSREAVSREAVSRDADPTGGGAPQPMVEI